MAIFGNGLLGGQQPGMQQPMLPRVPYRQNPMITTAALSLLGGRNINEGLANVAATAPAGMAAKSGMQQFMLAQQEKQAQKAEADARKAQMNEMLKMWPNLSPEQRALAQLYPDQFAQSTFKQMEGGGGVESGLTPIYGKDAAGNPVLMLPNKAGQITQPPLPDGVTLTPGVDKVDLGTHWGILNRAGEVTSTVPKDIAGAEREKVIGGGQGERIANLPKVEQQASTMLTTLDRLEKHPGFDSAVGTLGGLVPDWAIPPGTDMRGFNSLLKQVQGQSFLQAFESLKGGGQITEVEGRRATEAINRLERGLKPEEFRQAINEIREVINIGLERARNGIVVGGQTAPTVSGENDPLGIR